MSKCIEVKCATCSKSFSKPLKYVNECAKKGWKHYCSPVCKSTSKLKAIQVVCSNCGKSIRKSRSEINHSITGRLFCSRSCSQSFNNKNWRRGKNHPSYTYGCGSYRAKALEYYGSKCTVCGYDIEAVLEVHHRDGNRNNNEVENLDVLCPNHHKEYGYGVRNYN